MRTLGHRGRDTAQARDGEGRVHLRRVARGGAFNAAGAVVTALANFALVVAVTRGFSKTEAGMFFVATSAFLIVSMAAKLGTPTGLVYFISRVRTLGKPEQLRSYLNTALPPVAVGAVALAATLYLIAPSIAHTTAATDPTTAVTYLRALAVFLPIAALSDVCFAATRGFGTMRPTALVDGVGRPLAQLLLVVAVVALGSSSLLTAAWAAPYALSLAAGGVWLARLHRLHTLAGPAASEGSASSTKRALSHGFWRYSAPRSVARVVQLTLQRLDILLVAALRGPAAAAVYAAATRLIVLGLLANRALYQAVQPQLASLLARDDRPRANDVYQTSTCWLMLATWPVFLCFATYSAWIMRVFGDYQAGAEALTVLGVAMLGATACGMVDVVLNMAGRTTWTMLNSLLALGVMVGLDLLLIPRYGILGAAIGWSAAILARNLISLAQAAFVLRLHPFGKGGATAAGLAISCFGVLPVCVQLATNGTIPTLASLVAALIIYSGGCWHRRGQLRLASLRAIREGSVDRERRVVCG